MTCIVGYIEDGAVWIGGDSQATAGLEMAIRADEKIFEAHGFLYGTSGSPRFNQILRYSFVPPRKKKNRDIMGYFTGEYIDKLMELLKDKGHAKIKDGVSGIESTFLIGHEGELFKIYGDYQVEVLRLQYNAAGCGEDFALGCLHGLKGIKMKPEERIRAALEAAETFSAGVSRPFVIKSI